jgi:hypothetical protein
VKQFEHQQLNPHTFEEEGLLAVSFLDLERKNDYDI